MRKGFVRMSLALFGCITMGILIIGTFHYVNFQQSIDKFRVYPLPVADFMEAFANSCFWRLMGHVAFVAYALGFAYFIVVLVIDALLQKIDTLLTKVVRIHPDAIKADRQAEMRIEEKFLTLKSIFLFYILAFALSVILLFFIDSLPYFLLAFVLLITCPVVIFLLRSNLVALGRQSTIKRKELLSYQNYSLLQIAVCAFLIISALLGMLAFTNFVAEQSASLFWSNFYAQWAERASKVYLLHPESFKDTYEEFLTSLYALSKEIEAESAAIVMSTVPQNLFQFAILLGLGLLAMMGLLFNLVFTQYFYGTTKTLSYVLLPILIGLLFWAAQFILPFSEKEAVIASITMVVIAYLSGVLVTNFVNRRLTLICPNPECQQPNEIDHKYCSFCGSELSEGEIRKRKSEK